MNIGLGILLALASGLPGIFLYNFYKDARDEYRRSGKYFWETLLISPKFFSVCLIAFLALLISSLFCLLP